ncbi:hypothetical protein CC78DRAFT_579482 [Lojkania enalia]|uniref:Uncharacterized protein n=1 Tax=Lojkania enalia TaxID=147567 RepID=A0A9P4N0U8_9PLEO|nr:hypothetical protein CC78DRAFT_579482 [Didymosphaeria enalia]
MCRFTCLTYTCGHSALLTGPEDVSYCYSAHLFVKLIAAVPATCHPLPSDIYNDSMIAYQDSRETDCDACIFSREKKIRRVRILEAMIETNTKVSEDVVDAFERKEDHQSIIHRLSSEWLRRKFALPGLKKYGQLFLDDFKQAKEMVPYLMACIAWNMEDRHFDRAVEFVATLERNARRKLQLFYILAAHSYQSVASDPVIDNAAEKLRRMVEEPCIRWDSESTNSEDSWVSTSDDRTPRSWLRDELDAEIDQQSEISPLSSNETKPGREKDSMGINEPKPNLPFATPARKRERPNLSIEIHTPPTWMRKHLPQLAKASDLPTPYPELLCMDLSSPEKGEIKGSEEEDDEFWSEFESESNKEYQDSAMEHTCSNTSQHSKSQSDKKAIEDKEKESSQINENYKIFTRQALNSRLMQLREAKSHLSYRVRCLLDATLLPVPHSASTTEKRSAEEFEKDFIILMDEFEDFEQERIY